MLLHAESRQFFCRLFAFWAFHIKRVGGLIPDAINWLVSNYEELGKYQLSHDMDVPQDLHQYMNLYALGFRYEDEHPGLFVGDDYVAYPAEAPEQEMKLEMT